MIGDFDVERWANLVEEMGAGWVTGSVTWASQCMPAPIAAREVICPGFGSKRDLLTDAADALAKRHTKRLLYYHPGHATRQWWEAYALGPDGQVDRDKWFADFVRVVTEMGRRCAS